MEDPAQEIGHIVRSLTMGSPQQQEHAVTTYFLSDASFAHPFCRVPSFPKGAVPLAPKTDSRSIILAVYRMYRTLSPRIRLSVESSVFDPNTGLIYLSIHQIFSLWYLPFHKADVQLITVLQLVQQASSESGHTSADSVPSSGKKQKGKQKRRKEASAASEASTSQSSASTEQGHEELKYYIASQQDFYQVNDFLKFLAPLFVSLFVFALQLLNTVLCVVGSVLLRPLYHFLNDVSDREVER